MVRCEAFCMSLYGDCGSNPRLCAGHIASYCVISALVERFRAFHTAIVAFVFVLPLTTKPFSCFLLPLGTRNTLPQRQRPRRQTKRRRLRIGIGSGNAVDEQLHVHRRFGGDADDERRRRRRTSTLFVEGATPTGVDEEPYVCCLRLL